MAELEMRLKLKEDGKTPKVWLATLSPVDGWSDQQHLPKYSWRHAVLTGKDFLNLIKTGQWVNHEGVIYKAVTLTDDQGIEKAVVSITYPESGKTMPETWAIVLPKWKAMEKQVKALLGQ